MPSVACDRCNDNLVGLRFELDVPALRRAAAALSDAPIVELQLDFKGSLAKEAGACWPAVSPPVGSQSQAAGQAREQVAAAGQVREQAAAGRRLQRAGPFHEN